ncbi:MAG: branched-chain amino acid ABC transporter substrate-binding protein [Dehalococcoidia bacterium]
MIKTRHKASWTWLVALIAIVPLLAIACAGDDDDDDGDVTYGTAGFKEVRIEAGQPIKIGVTSVLSGDLQGLGLPIAEAAELAGKGKTINGHAIEFVRADGLCSADGGVAAATQIIQAGVVAAVGPICSGAVIASQPQYEAAGITQISPSSTAVGSTAPARGQVFQTFLRTTYNDAIQGPVQAEFAYDTLGAKTVYVVHDTDAYGQGLAESFSAAFEDAGGEIVGTEGYEKKATDFASIVTNIQNEDPDLVYMSGFYAEAIPFIKQLRAQNKDVLFLAGDGVKNDEFTKGAGAEAEGAYLTLPSPVYESDAYNDFGEAFEAETGGKRDASPFVAEAYDAVSIILAAIEEVAEEDGDALVIDLEKLNDEIRDTEIDGAAGHISFDARGENTGGETPVSLFVVKDGAIVAYEA